MPILSPIPPTFTEFLQDFGLNDSSHRERSAIEELFDQLHSHEREESALLAEYEAAANASSDAGVRFLMGLVLEDEKRHHALTQAMADDVNKSLQWLPDGVPLPQIAAAGAERERLLAQTRHFLDIERTGMAQLEALRAQVKELRSGLLELIVTLMLMDTRKHVEILRFVERRLAA